MENTRTFGTIDDVIVGASLLGQAMQGDATIIMAIMLGEMDRELGVLTHFKLMGSHAGSEEDLKLPAVAQKVENIKDFFRQQVSNAIASDARDQTYRDKAQERKDLEALGARLRASNKPHPMGTVDQMAKQFNVSKSEIRRRKAEGTLDELLVATQPAA